MLPRREDGLCDVRRAEAHHRHDSVAGERPVGPGCPLRRQAFHGGLAVALCNRARRRRPGDPDDISDVQCRCRARRAHAGGRPDQPARDECQGEKSDTQTRERAFMETSSESWVQQAPHAHANAGRRTFAAPSSASRTSSRA